MTTPGRGRWGALAVLGAVFVSGGLSGAALMRVYDARTADAPTVERERTRDAPRARRGDRGRRGGSDRFVRGLVRRLELTTEQEASVREILAASRAHADSVYGEVEPRIREHLEETRARIRALLTEEQRAEYDRMFEERRRTPPPPGHRP